MIKRKRKSRATWLSIELMSNGLNYEECGDHEAEQHVEYVTGDEGSHEFHAGDMQFENNHHELLRLSSSKIQDILNDCTDWSKVRAKMHEYHTEAVDHCAREDLGLDLQLKHDSGDTALIKLSKARTLLQRMKRDKCEAFRTIFEEEDRSWPRRRPEDCLATPLREWSSDNLGCLLRAALEIGKEVDMRLSTFERNVRKASGLPITVWTKERTEREFDSAVFDSMYGDDGGYHAWSEAVDWPEYNKKIDEARAELFNELSKEDKQMLIDKQLWEGERSWHARCLLTLEMDLVGGKDGVRTTSWSGANLSQMV